MLLFKDIQKLIGSHGLLKQKDKPLLKCFAVVKMLVTIYKVTLTRLKIFFPVDFNQPDRAYVII